jgi:glycine cleavage system protein P-like pyridoxal-binding family
MFDSCPLTEQIQLAAMAGMKIIVTKTMENGNIDVEAEQRKRTKDTDNCLVTVLSG